MPCVVLITEPVIHPRKNSLFHSNACMRALLSTSTHVVDVVVMLPDSVVLVLHCLSLNHDRTRRMALLSWNVPPCICTKPTSVRVASPDLILMPVPACTAGAVVEFSKVITPPLMNA